VDPTVTAAFIGGGAAIISGGWTALVAITTNRNARWTNQAALDAAAESNARTLDAARDERIWEKRAEVYLDAMRLVRHREDVRENTARTLRYDDETEESIKEDLASFKLPDWRDVELRLLAYASLQVIDAIEVSGTAHQLMEKAYQDWTWAKDWMRQGGPGAPTAEQIAQAAEAIKTALKEADIKDALLMAAIRADLHFRPSQSNVQAGDDEGAGDG
jgi:hypothetical protein